MMSRSRSYWPVGGCRGCGGAFCRLPADSRRLLGRQLGRRSRADARSAACPKAPRSARQRRRPIRPFTTCRLRVATTVLTDAEQQSSRAIWPRPASRAAGAPARPLPHARDQAAASGSRRSLLSAQRSPQRAEGAGAMEEFHRIRRLPPYVFEQVNRAKAAARNAGADIIDLGMGNPDLPAPAHVIEKLKETIGKPRTDRYSASKGIAGSAPRAGRLLRAPLRREAQSRDRRSSRRSAPRRASPTWRRRSPRRATSSWCPNPSYPIHAFGFLMAGGVIRSVPSEPTPAFFSSARARDHALDPQAARGRGLLSVQSDRLCRRSRLLQGAGPVREEARHLRALRSRLCRGLFRRQSAAVGAAGAGRDRRRGRVHLDVEDLFDAGLAHRLRGRQRAHHRGARRG